MIAQIETTFIIVSILFLCVTSSYDPFIDNVPFNIAWPGSEPSGLTGDLPMDDNTLVVMTNNQEKYKCYIPDVLADPNEETIETYTGPSEMELLKPLFEQTSCSYRIESYWTYELCHGKSLRQYHEEKDPNQKTRLQQYMLGYYGGDESAATGASDSSGSQEEEKDTEPSVEGIKNAPLKKVEGVELPYFEISFTDGTTCDLTGRRRQASLFYVCHAEGTGEIYELKETFTCGYELVVLTSVLCDHPLYRIKKDPVNQILCHSVEGAPRLPISLKELQKEEKRAPYNKRDYYIDMGDGKQAHTDSMPRKVHISYKAANKKENKPSSTVTSTTAMGPDIHVLENFLKGEYCIHGGTGWWKHEFCYGKHILQYHKDKGDKISIFLGSWNVRSHLEWIEANPSKRPKSEERKSVSHYYGNGDICELTGRNRHTEVKLKCVISPSQPSAISIYLVEPTTCTYLLVVESQLFCDIIEKADNNGLWT